MTGVFGKAMAVAGVAAVLLATSASAAQAHMWALEPTPNPGPDENVFFAASPASTSDVWAVGRAIYGDISDGGNWKPLIARRSYTGWRVVHGAAPPPGTNLSELTGVAARSADDAWAVGIAIKDERHRTSLAEHWDGAGWTLAPLAPFGHLELRAVTTVPGTRTYWAVGAFDGGAGSAFFDAAAWHSVPVPQPGQPGPLNGVAAVGPKDVWAVGSPSFPGFATNLPPFAEHFDGSSWSVHGLPGPFGKYDSPAVVAVAAVPHSHEFWAVGYNDPGTSLGEVTLLYHFTGGRWHHVPSPDPRTANALYGVTALSPDNVWAFGYSRNRGDPLPHALVLHLTKTGWHVVTLRGSTAHGVLQAGTFDATRLWAVGSTTFPDNAPFTASTLAMSMPGR